MATSKATWILLISITGFTCAVLTRQEGFAFATLAVVIWVAVTWIRVRVKTSMLISSMSSVERVFEGLEGNIALNLDQSYKIRINADLPKRLGGLRVRIDDIIPTAFAIHDGFTSATFDNAGSKTISWQYQLKPVCVGKCELPGFNLSISDPSGLFEINRFVPCSQPIMVLPFLIRPQSTVSVLKTRNQQLLAGIHRHRRPGFSAELLGIREYTKGDPPRSIAWKATAKLGKLMTCEYESEVPIRSTVLIDLSSHQFLGRPGPATADRSIASAGSIARLLLADKDPVACHVIADEKQRRISHGQGERHLTRILQSLLPVHSKSRVSESLTAEELTDRAWVNCLRRFPELLDIRVNPTSFGISNLLWEKHSLSWTSLLLYIATGIVPMLLYRFATLLWKSFSKQQTARQREQLSYVFTQFYNLPPEAAIQMQFNDASFTKYCRTFLVDYPYAEFLPIASLNEEETIASQQNANQTMSNVLLQSVARANDNELFVLIGTAPSHDEQISVLVESIKVALGAYHRVVFIDVGFVDSIYEIEDRSAQILLQQARQRSSELRAQRLKQRLAKIGVPVSCVHDPKMMELVASELRILKSGRSSMART